LAPHAYEPHYWSDSRLTIQEGRGLRAVRVLDNHITELNVISGLRRRVRWYIYAFQRKSRIEPESSGRFDIHQMSGLSKLCLGRSGRVDAYMDEPRSDSISSLIIVTERNSSLENWKCQNQVRTCGRRQDVTRLLEVEATSDRGWCSAPFRGSGPAQRTRHFSTFASTWAISPHQSSQ